MNKYAFPSAHDPKTGVAQIGMTLRDYLATAAMQGLIARGVNPESIPRLAYEYADKMLKERDETPKPIPNSNEGLTNE